MKSRFPVPLPSPQNMSLPLLSLPLLLLPMLLLLAGCGLVGSVAGGNVDRERYALAREAAAMDVRHRGALQLSARLLRAPDPTDADLVLQLEEDFVIRMLTRLQGRRGWLDERTPYVIDSVSGDLHHGSALVTLHLRVRSEAHGVDVYLMMDTQLALIPDGDALRVEFEPYHVTPDVQAVGLLSAAEDVIADVIRVRLGTLREQFPPLRLPLGIDQQLQIDGNTAHVHGSPNLVVHAPRRLLSYTLQLRDVLIFDRHVLVSADLRSLGVK
ncbi:MAG: hypothetical protein RRA94_04965 [Bacteroidota bacterium]|nr:hypothetical protein [Bacteroidota bacterium]